MCHFVHAAADAAIALHGQGVAVGEHRTHRRAAAGRHLAGGVRTHRRQAPSGQTTTTPSSACPMPWPAACCAAGSDCKNWCLRPSPNPPRCALMDRVHCEVDPASTFPRHYSGEVRVTLEDGQVLTPPRGGQPRPRRAAAVQRRRAREIPGQRHAALQRRACRSRAVAVCSALPQLADVTTLESLLAQRSCRTTAKPTTHEHPVFPLPACACWPSNSTAPAPSAPPTSPISAPRSSRSRTTRMAAMSAAMSGRTSSARTTATSSRPSTATRRA